MAGKSLKRKRGAKALAYRSGYLGSEAWAARRRAYYGGVWSRGFVAMCQVCGKTGADGVSLHLHHLSYEGVRRGADGVWVAGEKDEDLLPLCETDHESLHKILDDFSSGYRGWSRRAASLRIVQQLRARSGLSV